MFFVVRALCLFMKFLWDELWSWNWEVKCNASLFFFIKWHQLGWSSIKLILTPCNASLTRLCFFLNMGGKWNCVCITSMQLLCCLYPEMGMTPHNGNQGTNTWALCKVILSFCFSGHNVGSLFHMADDLGRAMESLVSVMTDEEGAE